MARTPTGELPKREHASRLLNSRPLGSFPILDFFSFPSFLSFFIDYFFLYFSDIFIASTLTNAICLFWRPSVVSRFWEALPSIHSEDLAFSGPRCLVSRRAVGSAEFASSCEPSTTLRDRPPAYLQTTSMCRAHLLKQPGATNFYSEMDEREREREPTSIRLITPPWGIESSVHGAARKGRVEEGGDIWKEHRIETALMVSDDDRLSSEMNCYNILICLVWRSSVSDWPLAPGGYRLVATVTNPVPLIMVSLCGSRRGRCGNVTRIASSRIFVSRIPYLSCGRSWDVCGTSPRFSFLFLFSTAFRFEPTWTIFVVVPRFATTGWRREPMNTSSSWTCAALSWRLFVSERKKCLVDAALLSRSPTWWNAFLWCLPIKNYEPMIGVDMNQRKASS